MLLEQKNILKNVDQNFPPHIISIHKVSCVLYVYRNKNVEHLKMRLTIQTVVWLKFQHEHIN